MFLLAPTATFKKKNVASEDEGDEGTEGDDGGVKGGGLEPFVAFILLLIAPDRGIVRPAAVAETDPNDEAFRVPVVRVPGPVAGDVEPTASIKNDVDGTES